MSVKINLGSKRISYNVVTFWLVFAMFFLFSCFKDVKHYYYDAWYYWTIADSCLQSGAFQLLDFPEIFRGNFYPLVMLGVKSIGNAVFGGEYWGWRLLSSFMCAGMFAYILPHLFEHKIKSVSGLVRILLLSSVVIIIWGDYLQYPLSDFTAFTLISSGVAILKFLLSKEEFHLKQLPLAILAGACLYASYNTRVAFLYGILCVLIIFGVVTTKKKKVWICWCGLLVGIVLLAIPQSMINYKYVHSISPRVFTEQYTGYQKGLETQQVYWGLTNQRYETYVGSEEEYPEASVYFLDDAGSKLVEREGLTIDSFGYGDIIRLFLKYPLDVIGIYFRHFVTLLAPLYTEVYITDIYTTKGLLITAVFFIWFAFGIALYEKIKQKKLNILTFSMSLSICLPSFLQLMGAPELRFFLPVHFMAYFYVVCYVDWSPIIQKYKRNKMEIAVLFALIYVFWITTISGILGSNKENTLLINDVKTQEVQELKNTSD